MPRGVYERKKRKKRVVKARKNSYIGMYSECGGFEQLAVLESDEGGYIVGKTPAEVREKLSAFLDSHGIEEGAKVAVVQVIEVGHEPPRTFAWGGPKVMDL